MTKLLPADAQTYSKAPSRYPEGSPSKASQAAGAWVWGERLVKWPGLRGRLLARPGKRYVDLTSGLGAVILGHRHPAVDEAIRAQLERGISFPLPTRLEERVARRLLDMLTWPKAESVRFGKNGADVTGTAVRLARAVTGRQMVAYMHYHGHHDWCMTEPPMNAGVPEGAGGQRVRDLEFLMAANPQGLAAIVLEAVDSAKPKTLATDFRALRSWCDENETLLILDEMVTGFRMAPGGAAEVYGIEPDLACYGKAMANGMPLSAIVGPWDILKRYEENVFFSTTHGGEALSLAAAEATLRIIASEDVPARLGQLGQKLQGMATGSYGYPQRVMFSYRPEQLAAMVAAGVLTQGYANLTLAHVEDRDATLAILNAILRAEEVP